MRFGALMLAFTGVLLTSGCASMNPMPTESEALQREAIARWHDCLSREDPMPVATRAKDTARALRDRCEGHRRDVLMSFPASMEPQLEDMMREHTMKNAFKPQNTRPPLFSVTPSGLPAQLPSATAIQSAR